MNVETSAVRGLGAADRFARAVAFAFEAHTGQLYGSAGWTEPYVCHPIRVAMAVSEGARVVAVLHDVAEDTGAPLPPWLTGDESAALIALTRDDNEGYFAYIERCATNPLAREVKIADLRDNLAHNPPGNLRERYEKALRTLGSEESE
jgi:hypothetical protein